MFSSTNDAVELRHCEAVRTGQDSRREESVTTITDFLKPSAPYQQNKEGLPFGQVKTVHLAPIRDILTCEEGHFQPTNCSEMHKTG
jgi:hypothetical protein